MDNYSTDLEKAKAGDIEAMCNLGEGYYKELSYEERLLWLKKSADLGYTKAQYEYGMECCFSEEQYKISDDKLKEGLNYLKQAQKNNYSLASSYIKTIYKFKDDLKLASTNNDADAMYRLGSRHFYYNELTHDERNKFLKKAEALGHKRARGLCDVEDLK